MATRTPPFKAPDFALHDTQGATKRLSDYAGRWLIVYFYPKDDTPGCTTEACSLRDAATALSEMDAEIVGISADDTKSHEAFMKKHHLNFTLLSDPDKKTIVAYGAWGKKMFGREGILRKTFIIDPKGKVVKVYGRVTPLGHGDQLLEALQKLQKDA